jgi:hypothetical protein
LCAPQSVQRIITNDVRQEGYSAEIIKFCGSKEEARLPLGSQAFGAAEGIRTPDPRITNAVLYQLSYRGDELL